MKIRYLVLGGFFFLLFTVIFAQSGASQRIIAYVESGNAVNVSALKPLPMYTVPSALSNPSTPVSSSVICGNGSETQFPNIPIAGEMLVQLPESSTCKVTWGVTGIGATNNWIKNGGSAGGSFRTRISNANKLYCYAISCPTEADRTLSIYVEGP